MTDRIENKYPSESIVNYPRKLAFLIDCNPRLSTALFSHLRLIDHFPLNSDIFLFYNRHHTGLNRRFKRLETDNHGIYLFPSSEHGIELNISYILGTIQEKYDDFILVVQFHPAYPDLCKQLVDNRLQLKNHVQLRTFARPKDFVQFVQELTRLQQEKSSETHVKDEPLIVNYTSDNLFHYCPLETLEQSSYLYRFGELLHHLDLEHPNVNYEYCQQCQTMMQNKSEYELFAQHLHDEHDQNKAGFQLSIRSSGK